MLHCRILILALLALCLLPAGAWAATDEHAHGENHPEEQQHNEHHHAEAHDDHSSHQADGEHFRLLHAWVRATSGDEALLFVEIHNHGDHALVLKGLETDVCERAELVAFVLKDGQETYMPVPKISVPAHAEMALAPQGAAVKLMGLKRAFEQGQEFEVEFELEVEGEHARLHMRVQVEAAGAARHSHAGHQH